MVEGRVRIGQREVGDGRPCFVIAEAGINHNGDAALAAELVDAAAEAGADAIKFQTHFPEHEMLRAGATAAYVGESLFDLLTRTALSKEDHVDAARSRAEARDPVPVDAVLARSGRLPRHARRAGVQDWIGRADPLADAAAHRSKGQADDHLDRDVHAGGDRSHGAGRARGGSAALR